MGNRTYLSIEGEDSKLLFETNNSLASFWVGLLSHQALENTTKQWHILDERLQEGDEYADEDMTQTNPYVFDFKVSLSDFQERSVFFRSYLEQHFKTYLPLYDDFINYLKANQSSADDFYLIDLFQLCSFSSVAEFSEQLTALVASIDSNNPIPMKGCLDDDVASLTGFAYEESWFADQSVAYKSLIENRKTMFGNRPTSRSEARKPTLQSKAQGGITGLNRNAFVLVRSR